MTDSNAIWIRLEREEAEQVTQLLLARRAEVHAECDGSDCVICGVEQRALAKFEAALNSEPPDSSKAQELAERLREWAEAETERRDLDAKRPDEFSRHDALARIFTEAADLLSAPPALSQEDAERLEEAARRAENSARRAMPEIAELFRGDAALLRSLASRASSTPEGSNDG